MSSVEEHYESIKDIYDREEFLADIEAKSELYDGLFDDELLAHLIVAEEGRNDGIIKNISDLRAGESATVIGRVVDLGVLRTFKKKGGEGKVRNVRIDDGKGSVKIVFWDDDTERLGEDIVMGCELTVVNGYVQDKGYGLQISTGKWGLITVKGEGEKD